MCYSFAVAAQYHQVFSGKKSRNRPCESRQTLGVVKKIYIFGAITALRVRDRKTALM